MSPIIELKNIYKTYHVGEIDVPVLRGVSFSINKGEYVALMGASGSGKTTLMNILGCLDHPSSGYYGLDSSDVSSLSSDQRAVVRNKKIGFVFQSFNLLRRTSAVDNVVMPLQYAENASNHEQAVARAKELLIKVGLSDRLNHEPSQLSGGQQQRVAIARSLINSPAILLADEPTGNLDSHTAEDILSLFKEINIKEGITLLMVTHEPKVAAHADRTIHIQDGLILDTKGEA